MGDGAILAIDISHSTLTAAFVFPDGRVEGEAGFDLADFMSGDGDYVDKLSGLLSLKVRPFKSVLEAAMVSIPCDLSADRRQVLDFPHALWMNHKPLADILEKALGIPVTMERRAVVHLCYDRAMLGLPEKSLIVGCYIGEHYENAIWYRGGPLLGKNGAAGNIAHMTIHDREDNCFCGKYGCVDLYGTGIRFNQMHTMIFPDSPKEQFFEQFGDHPIIQDYLHMMAYPIAIEANILDPDFVVIGGSIPCHARFPHENLGGSHPQALLLPASLLIAGLFAVGRRLGFGRGRRRSIPGPPDGRRCRIIRLLALDLHDIRQCRIGSGRPGNNCRSPSYIMHYLRIIPG